MLVCDATAMAVMFAARAAKPSGKRQVNVPRRIAA